MVFFFFYFFIFFFIIYRYMKNNYIQQKENYKNLRLDNPTRNTYESKYTEAMSDDSSLLIPSTDAKNATSKGG
jgi:hypothetical protein